MKKKWIVIGAAALVVVVGSVGAVSMKSRGQKAPEVQTGKVSRQKIVQKVSGTGKIQPKTQVKISADVSARINKLAVVEGQNVQKGQLLVELDRERYLAMVESGEANVRSATSQATLVKQNMMQAEREFNRTKEMMNQKLTSQSIYDAAEAAYQVEVARYASANEQAEQARAALKQARDDLSKTTIYSPMAGTVTDLNKEQGEIAIGSQFQPDVILVVADLSEMEAQVNVDENDIVQIGIGQEAEITVDALPDQVLKGKVSEIANSANASAAGTAEQKTEFEIKIAISEPPQTLRPGMTATADVFTKTNENALSVPIACVAVRTVDQLAKKGEDVKKAEETYKADKDGFVEIVFVIDAGKAVAHPVKTGIQSDELIEIIDGLKEGEEVVTGSYRAISKDLTNGGVVTVNNNPKPAKGGAKNGGDGEMAEKK
ncbi:MAG TPA: efflux RND transporter periplasmic adaptor subunit [Candidatus Krumholzibacteria bacterium]|jgi:HlyD family secretion protein|nr:efflux RND transporter periplasmic adaptor subunit [Candidatus Krumholzibacteria bacterium]